MAAFLLRFDGGARGVLWASQVAVGQENSLRLRIYGERGGMEWRQEEPNTLVVHRAGQAHRDQEDRHGLRRSGGLGQRPAFRPAHPEGYIEGFANIYNSFADALSQVLQGNEVDESKVDYPNVHDGVRGMAFLEAVVGSSNGDLKWVQVPS